MVRIPVIYSGKGQLPTYATAASAGMDLRAAIVESISLAPMERKSFQRACLSHSQTDMKHKLGPEVVLQLNMA